MNLRSLVKSSINYSNHISKTTSLEFEITKYQEFEHHINDKIKTVLTLINLRDW